MKGKKQRSPHRPLRPGDSIGSSRTERSRKMIEVIETTNGPRFQGRCGATYGRSVVLEMAVTSAATSFQDEISTSEAVAQALVAEGLLNGWPVSSALIDLLRHYYPEVFEAQSDDV